MSVCVLRITQLFTCGLGLFLFTQCSSPSGPRTGSQTHWLRSCDDATDCGELSCICGACTLACDETAACDTLTGASCLPAEGAGATALCSGNPPTQAGLCLPECSDESCAEGLSCVAGACTPTPISTVTVTIDPLTRHQTLVGFGASLAYTDDELAAHPEKEALYDVMFGDSGLDVVRMRNRYDGSGDEDLNSTVEILEAATERMGETPTTFITTGSPPAELKANGSSYCSGNPETCTLVQLDDGSFDYAGFTAYWRASLEAYQAVGVFPDFVSIQNNPNWVPPASETNEACRFLPTEGSVTVTSESGDVEVEYPGYAEALAQVVNEFATLANPPQIAAPETTSLEPLASYLAELNPSLVDAIGHHLYGTDPLAVSEAELRAASDLSEEYGLPIFQTEMTADGLGTAVLMTQTLTVEGVSAYLQDNWTTSALALDDNSGGLISLSSDSFELQDPFYAMQHFGAYTNPGWVRVDALSDSNSVLSSAWQAPEDEGLTVILVNPSLDDVDLELEIPSDTRDLYPNSRVVRTTFAGVERFTELGELSEEHVVRVPGQAVVTVALTP